MATKKLVIISTGVELSPLLLEFLQSSLEYSIILNTVIDFYLPDNESQDKDKSKSKPKNDGIWYHHEIVKLANALVPDDLTKSSLTKIFSRPISQTKIPLTESERFLVQWVSERHKAEQDFTTFFQALSEYASKSISVFTLNFPKKDLIRIRTKSSEVPLRYFQITGYIDRDSEVKTDLEELQKLLVESQGTKDKKKAKPLIEVVGLDRNQEILNEKTKKVIEEADAILFLPGDPCSLVILLLYKEFVKFVKESKASVTLVAPTKFTFREQFILQLLQVKPTLQGLAELGSGIIDHFVVGPGEASEVAALRTKGFNVIMEDLSKGSKAIEAILKGMGISTKELSGEGEISKTKDRNLEDLVTQLSYKQEKEVADEKDTTEITEVATKKADAEPSERPVTVELQDTTPQNFDFQDPSLKLTQVMIETLMEELNTEVSTKDQSSVVIDPEMIEPSSSDAEKSQEKPTEPSEIETQEAFTEAIQKFLSDQSYSKDSKLVIGITNAIAKNSDMAAHAAKRITGELGKQTARLIPIYVDFIKKRPLVFLKALTDWFLVDLSSTDFVGYTQRVSIINQIAKHDLQFIENFVEQIVIYHMTKSLVPIEREHVRSLIGMVTVRDITLQRKAIQTYLSFYEKSDVKLDDLWLGLLKFDAGLVSLEIIEHQSRIGVKLVQDALSRNIGSFGHILYDVFQTYQKGDIQRVLSIAGSLSDSLLRKRSRAELAEKIRKLGSVPIETLARSTNIEPSELESLVLEMINENEINAKIEVIEGRLCIVQINSENGEGKKKASE
ncbi:MAG: PCI domain-containing protein [Candidatus Hodarchaeales archaeon]